MQDGEFQKPLPIDDYALQDLLAWRQLTPFKGPDDWVFASARRAGRQPYWPDSLLRKRVRPAAQAAGITATIGWHTFRRSFSSWLKTSGADMKVIHPEAVGPEAGMFIMRRTDFGYVLFAAESVCRLMDTESIK